MSALEAAGLSVAVTSGPEGEILVAVTSADDSLAVRVSPDGRAEACRSDGSPAQVPASAALALLDVHGRIEDALALIGVPGEGMDLTAAEARAALAEAGAGRAADMVDARAVAALSAVAQFRSADLAFYSGEGEKAERRRQAAGVAPLFAAVVAANLKSKMAVDKGTSLTDPLLAAVQGLSSHALTKAALKRLCAVREGCDPADLRTACTFSAGVPADWIPAGGAEWRAFCVAARALVGGLGATADQIASLTKGCGGKWTDFCARMAREADNGPEEDAEEAAPDHDPERAVIVAATDARDMISTFADVVVIGLAAHSTGDVEAGINPESRSVALELASRMLTDGRSAPSLIQSSRRWHHHRGAILEGTRLLQQEVRDQVLQGVAPGGWPTLTEPVQAPNGLWLIPLGAPEELRWEGGGYGGGNDADPTGAKGLNHCVGGYSSKCLSGDCHIVSIRQVDEEGRYTRVATVEFKGLELGSDALDVMQLRGPGNGDPGTKAKDAVAWYITGCARGSIPLDRHRLDAFHEERRGAVDASERICGYDWRDRDQLNAAVAPWGSFVTSAWKGRNLDGLMASDEIGAVAGAFTPVVRIAGFRGR